MSGCLTSGIQRSGSSNLSPINGHLGFRVEGLMARGIEFKPFLFSLEPYLRVVLVMVSFISVLEKVGCVGFGKPQNRNETPTPRTQHLKP